MTQTHSHTNQGQSRSLNPFPSTADSHQNYLLSNNSGLTSQNQYNHTIKGIQRKSLTEIIDLINQKANGIQSKQIRELFKIISLGFDEIGIQRIQRMERADSRQYGNTQKSMCNLTRSTIISQKQPQIQKLHTLINQSKTIYLNSIGQLNRQIQQIRRQQQSRISQLKNQIQQVYNGKLSGIGKQLGKLQSKKVEKGQLQLVEKKINDILEEKMERQREELEIKILELSHALDALDKDKQKNKNNDKDKDNKGKSLQTNPKDIFKNTFDQNTINSVVMKIQQKQPSQKANSSNKNTLSKKSSLSNSIFNDSNVHLKTFNIIKKSRTISRQDTQQNEPTESGSSFFRYTKRNSLDQSDTYNILPSQGQFSCDNFFKMDLNQKNKQNFNKVSAINWIDKESLYYDNLIFEKQRIIAKDWSRVFGKYIKKQVLQFTVKVVKVTKFIGLGMADSEYKSNNSQKGLDNRIYFVNTGGYRIGSDWIDNQKQTKGFKVGQKVKVVVNFGLGVIQWKVNESVRLKLKCDSLKDNSIKWVPYLWFNSSGDCIEICDY